jgi:hypothetical protein
MLTSTRSVKPGTGVGPGALVGVWQTAGAAASNRAPNRSGRTTDGLLGIRSGDGIAESLDEVSIQRAKPLPGPTVRIFREPHR